jgi:FG-GAP-like repeat
MRIPCLILTLLAMPALALAAQDYRIHTFQRVQLTDVYYAEGAGFGDFNHDRVMDVVAGPYWYAGPDFKTKHELYPAKPQDRNRYADNFFSFVYDFNADGWDDVFVVGFPGTSAYWYENPQGRDQAWVRHEVFDWVSNESPHFTDLVGDARPELVCTRQGMFGYATVDWKAPTAFWRFHPISEDLATDRFGHGLGVGDVDGDGRKDVLWQNGWFQQPETLGAKWEFHPFVFTKAGGSQMFAYDVDGDGDNDVITGLAAHEHGLAWFEQVKDGGGITFKRHLIMGNLPGDNPYGVCFSELHAMDLYDVDGDGLKDIVTGKTYWSHHTSTPSWHDGAVVYWFRLVRSPSGVDFVPYRADDNSGLGRQVVTGDLNGDGLPDIVSANMQGAFALIHHVKSVSAGEWAQAQPKRYHAPAAGDLPHGILPLDEHGQPLNLDFETGSLKDWKATGDAFAGQPVKGEINPKRKWAEGKTAKPQGDYWIGGFEPSESDTGRGTLTSDPFEVTHPYAAYRIGGGCSQATRLELVEAGSGRVLFQTFGRNSETMFPEVVDLGPIQGKRISIRLVDDASQGFGHLNFDDFRFYSEPPSFPDAVCMVKTIQAN